jgi:hypothetical protein
MLRDAGSLSEESPPAQGRRRCLTAAWRGADRARGGRDGARGAASLPRAGGAHAPRSRLAAPQARSPNGSNGSASGENGSSRADRGAGGEQAPGAAATGGLGFGVGRARGQQRLPALARLPSTVRPSRPPPPFSPHPYHDQRRMPLKFLRPSKKMVCSISPAPRPLSTHLSSPQIRQERPPARSHRRAAQARCA